MSLDDATTHDSTLIDEDLVASLGFEPTQQSDIVVDDEIEIEASEEAGGDASQELEDADPVAVEATDLTQELAVVDPVELAAMSAPANEGASEVEEPLFGTAAADNTIDLDNDEDGDGDGADDDEALASNSGAEIEVASEESLAGSEALSDPVDGVEDEDLELFDIEQIGDDLGDPDDLTPLISEADSVLSSDEQGQSMTLDSDEAAIFDLRDGDDIRVLDEPTIATPVAASSTAGVGAPTTIRIRRKKLRARKVRRVVRHIDPWSVLTFSILFHLVFFASLLLASILVWNAAVQAGTIDNIENFIRELGDYETFNINSDVVFRAGIIIAGMLTLASSILMVLLTVVFNLISDLVGGIRMTVVEEDTVVVPQNE